MAEAKAAVYDPPSADMPYVAIIVLDGAVIFAKEVDDPDEGQARLAAALTGLGKMAKDQGYT